jgi:hypothetical protein
MTRPSQFATLWELIRRSLRNPFVVPPCEEGLNDDFIPTSISIMGELAETTFQVCVNPGCPICEFAPECPVCKFASTEAPREVATPTALATPPPEKAG